jgi:hypothetical protein
VNEQAYRPTYLDEEWHRRSALFSKAERGVQ